jgi:hypothetical protein
MFGTTKPGNGWKLRASRIDSGKDSEHADASRLLELAVSSVLCLLSF